jgi:flagellar protein FlaG
MTMSNEINLTFSQLRNQAFLNAKPTQLSAKEATEPKLQLLVSTPSTASSDVNQNFDSQTLRSARQNLSVEKALVEESQPGSVQFEKSREEQKTPTYLHLSELLTPIEQFHKTNQQVNRSLEFAVDDDSNQTIITVIDRDNDEIIRQIPTESFIQLTKSLQQSDSYASKESGVFISTHA